MFLSELQLNGFKSFYSTTSIHFSEGITAIVGPNGCGKSNLIDAVRWVLGEQRPTQLRGEQISDLISAGNARRAAKSRAEAYLTFQGSREVLDTDGDEVEVGRKVDRDGEGTYLLNGETVRLKDIKDLFRDTGVGQDLYSIIGQGEVRQLIDSKPEERREIVEEAAGIASFRHRRDLTRRRLKQTREELGGVAEELQEKQGRLNQLTGQAEKASRVRTLQTTIRELKREEWRREFLRLNEEIDRLENREEEREKQLREAREQKQSVEEEKRRLQDQSGALDSRLERLSQLRGPTARSRQEKREQAGRLETRSESLLEQIQREKQRGRDRLQQARREVDQSCRRYRSRFETRLRGRILASCTRFLERMDEKRKAVKRDLNGQLEDLRSRTLFQISEEEQIKHRLESIREDQRDQRRGRRELEEDVEQSLARVREDRARRRAAFEELVEVESSRVKKRLRVRRLNSRLETLREIGERWGERQEECRQTLHVQENRLDTLRGLQREYEGFSSGVRSVMKAHEQGRFSGVRGVVANLIEVADAHQTAIQALLGDDLQSVVVEDRDVARELIRYLNEEEAGRARLIPLREFQPRGNLDRRGVKSPQGVIAPADTVIECEPDLRPVVRDLVGRVLIVESVEAGQRLLDRLEDGGPSTCVTPGGELVHRNGALTGGSREDGRGDLLGRSRRLETLKREIERNKKRRDRFRDRNERVERKINSVADRRDQTLSSLEEDQSERREKRGRYVELVRGTRERLQGLDRQFEKLARTHHRGIALEHRRRGYTTLLQSVSGRESRRRRRIQNLQERLEALDEHLELLQGRWRSVESSLQEARSREQEADHRISRHETRVRELLEDRRGTLRQVRRDRRRWLEGERRRTRRRLEAEVLDRINRGWEALERGINHRRSELQHTLQEVNDRLQSSERTVQENRNKLDKTQRELANQRARLDETRRKIEEETDLAPRVEVLEDLDTGEVREYSAEELAKRRREAEQTVRDLRPVNMLADQQAEELREELEDIQTQKQDLETACEKLETMIQRLNEKARDRFREAFSEIRGYFSDFVSELFRGGEGRLGLTDDPVLESGVTVEVEPPGEKLKTMSALSGGEKSLAALAFLFALFERKPTPFCFLDEVDAALDDENVEQFIGLLDRYKQRTQFVIVTHNKGTMQAASQLYGVTMEESGVSSVVRMDLEEASTISEKQEV